MKGNRPRPETDDMQALLPELELRRTGSSEAQVGMISLPLPRAYAGRLRIDHPHADMRPVAWWERDTVARRAIAYVLDHGTVPETLTLTDVPARPAAPSAAWQFRTEATIRRESYTARPFANIEALRGVPASQCFTAQAQVELTYAGRRLVIQAGATGPCGGPHFWESVQIDPLWANAVAQGIRIGGVIYNEDTYLQADIYLVLFANGVADVAAHFVNTKLHIRGYDFQGLPVLRLAGDAVRPHPASFPADGLRVRMGDAELNLADAAILFSEEYPARIEAAGSDALFYPVSRTFNPQVQDAPPTEWPVGAARTVRFQLSLSAAPPVVARYTVSAWWYALCGEPWPGGILPVHGVCDRLGRTVCDLAREAMTRGRFDGGCGKGVGGSDAKGASGCAGNDGDAGSGILRNYHHTGCAELLRDGLDFCYFWADLMVDHTDFTVRQWVGGWGWKTCAYTKFRDVFLAYLETGDPYLLDTAEMVAEAYWAWFRVNWPRCSIGRDNFELGAWALMWRFMDSPHARDRTVELARMTTTVLDSRGTIGGQMGAGPHPGHLSSLYMTGVTMIALEEAAEAAVEKGDPRMLELVSRALPRLHQQFTRDDVELFPSNIGQGRDIWHEGTRRLWAIMALRIYLQMARLQGGHDGITRAGLDKAAASLDSAPKDWLYGARLVMFYTNPLYADAMLLGARTEQGGVSLEPLDPPTLWPGTQTVETPYGQLEVSTDVSEDEVRFAFSAPREFAVVVRHGGTEVRTTSRHGTVLARTSSCG